LLAGSGPGPRQKLVEPIVRPEIDEADKDMGEVGLRLDAVELAGLDQRSEDSPVFGPIVVTSEESIFSRQHLGSH